MNRIDSLGWTFKKLWNSCFSPDKILYIKRLCTVSLNFTNQKLCSAKFGDSLNVFFCFFCLSPGLLTLCGASLYIIYSYKALAETERQVGQECLAYVSTSFGWSLGLAWLSYGLELHTGILLLVAARMAKLRHSSPTMAWSSPPQLTHSVKERDWTQTPVKQKSGILLPYGFRRVWQITKWLLRTHLKESLIVLIYPASDWRFISWWFTVGGALRGLS